MRSPWEEIVEELEITLAEIPGVRIHKYLPERVEPPAIIVMPPAITYITCNVGSYTYEFDLWVIVGMADIRSGMTEIMLYMDQTGDKSISDILYSNRTLNGACDSLNVRTVESQVVTFGGTEFYGARFEMEVIRTWQKVTAKTST